MTTLWLSYLDGSRPTPAASIGDAVAIFAANRPTKKRPAFILQDKRDGPPVAILRILAKDDGSVRMVRAY